MELITARHSFTFTFGDETTATAERPAQTLPAADRLTPADRIRPTEATLTLDGHGNLIEMELTGPYHRAAGGDAPGSGRAYYNSSSAHREAAPIVERLIAAATAVLDGEDPAA